MSLLRIIWSLFNQFKLINRHFLTLQIVKQNQTIYKQQLLNPRLQLIFHLYLGDRYLDKFILSNRYPNIIILPYQDWLLIPINQLLIILASSMSKCRCFKDKALINFFIVEWMKAIKTFLLLKPQYFSLK